MREILCILCLVGFVFAISPIKTNFDIGDNHERIRKVFIECSTLNVLQNFYEQPESAIKWLDEIFGMGNKSFVVFNIANRSDHENFLEQCKQYKMDSSLQVDYYERAFKKYYSNNGDMKAFDVFENEYSEGQIVANKDKNKHEYKIKENFAIFLDKWRKFRRYGSIIFTSFDNLKHFIGCLCNRQGTFLYIVQDNVKNYESQVETIFHDTWKSIGSFKVFILINRQLLTYNPFKLVNNSYGASKLFTDLYTEDHLKHINGYQLNVELFWSAYSIVKELNIDKLSGPDVDVTRMIANRLNATIFLVQNNGKFGIKLPNGTLTGALGNLQRRKSDIVTTAFFMKDYETRSAEFTYPLYMDKLCAVVKKASRVPPELLPLVIFEDSLWFIIVCAGMFISVVWSLLRAINNRIRQPSSTLERVKFHVDTYNLSPYLAHQSTRCQHAQIFIDTWMLFLSIPMRRLTRAQYERFFVSSIILVSIILVNIYQSGLATVFTRPIYFKDIESLSQLDKSGNEIIVKYAGFLTDVFPNDTSEVYRNLRSKMRLVETNVTAMDLVKNEKSIATVTRKSTTVLDSFKYFAEKELHLVDKECPKEYYLAYMVPIKSVYLNRINEILMDIQRFGFIWKWIEDFHYEWKMLNLKSLVGKVVKLKVLTLNDLKFPFFILMGGNVFSILSFIVEVFLIRVFAKWRN